MRFVQDLSTLFVNFKPGMRGLDALRLSQLDLRVKTRGICSTTAISLQNQSVTKPHQKRHGDKLFGTEKGFIEIKQLPYPKTQPGVTAQ